MPNSTLQTILQNTFTKSDFYRRIDLVQEFLERYLFNTGGETSASRTELCVAYARKVGAEDVAAHLEEWGEEVLTAFSADNLYKEVSSLKEEMERLPEMVLYVPSALDSHGVSQIGAWCRSELGEQVMLNIIVDPSVVGGCAFAWNGAYHDFSLQYFLNKRREEVNSLIETYDAK